MTQATEKREVEEKKQKPTPVDPLLKEAVAPPIADVLDKVKAAVAQAKQAQKPKTKTGWNCTECDSRNVQLWINGYGYSSGHGHYGVMLEDGQPINPDTGEKLFGDERENMRIAMAKRGMTLKDE